MSSPAVALPAAGALTRRRNQFHSFASAALLLIVVAGFSPTLVAAIVANDLWTRRRPHPATVFGIALILSTNAVTGRIAATGLGQAFVRGLS